ncbi:hypothetical protein [Novosphingobium sp.]|uniref:hypothetical protein n=1 Tax=Novosphingobium sp. TaxID=1874826 RepID=UPI0035641202
MSKTTKGQRAALARAINRFERAVDDKAFQGTIPAGESDEAAAAYEAIDFEYERSRQLLDAMIDRYLS